METLENINIFPLINRVVIFALSFFLIARTLMLAVSLSEKSIIVFIFSFLFGFSIASVSEFKLFYLWLFFSFCLNLSTASCSDFLPFSKLRILTEKNGSSSVNFCLSSLNLRVISSSKIREVIN